ncbi:MAG TPA: TnsA-like heteromeric transposase endonuclease subunit, partial [Propionibacteriaceae bacterium]
MQHESLVGVDVRFLDGSGTPVSSPLGKVDAAAVVRGRPVRPFPSYRGQRNYPGWLWTATTGSLVAYESLLERDRLWLADFDPTVRWIASQPFWLTTREGSASHRHVPDFLVEHVDGGYTVVDVKPEDLVMTPEVA